MSNIRGYMVCQKCGIRIPQVTYDCDVLFVCKNCDCHNDKYDKEGNRIENLVSKNQNT
jgi:hypothetical protein